MSSAAAARVADSGRTSEFVCWPPAFNNINLYTILVFVVEIQAWSVALVNDCIKLLCAQLNTRSERVLFGPSMIGFDLGETLEAHNNRSSERAFCVDSYLICVNTT